MPFKAELVDRFLVQDKQSLDSRKFQRPFDGPYVVLSADNQYTATVAHFDLTTGQQEQKEVSVYLGQFRPTLALCKKHRAT